MGSLHLWEGPEKKKIEKTFKKTYNVTKSLENTDERENAEIERAPER